MNFSCSWWSLSPLDVVNCRYCGSANDSEVSAAVGGTRKASSAFMVAFRNSSVVVSAALLEAAPSPPNTTDTFAARLADVSSMWRSEVLFSICVPVSSARSGSTVERLCDCSAVKFTWLWLSRRTSEGPGEVVTPRDTAGTTVIDGRMDGQTDGQRARQIVFNNKQF